MYGADEILDNMAVVTTAPSVGGGIGESKRTVPNRLNMVFAPLAFARLLELASEAGVKPIEIMRRALSVYSYIMKTRKGNEATTRVMIDRGDGHPSELILPI